MMYETSDIRKGLKVVINNDPHVVVDFDFVKPGKGNAFTRCRLKNMVTGSTLDRTWKSGEKLTPAQMDNRDAQYLYDEGEYLVFMDGDNYEQYRVSRDVAGDAVNYLKESMDVEILLFEGKPLTVEMPNFVVLEVTDGGIGAKGDRATAATKEATLETGYVIKVPLFIETGDMLRIDTRTGEYVERAKL